MITTYVYARNKVVLKSEWSEHFNKISVLYSIPLYELKQTTTKKKQFKITSKKNRN